jgi:hypothetical protein
VNLKDWYNLTPEEQKKYWDDAQLRNQIPYQARRWLPEEDLKTDILREYKEEEIADALFSDRTRMILLRGGITSLDQLQNMSRQELLRIRGMGQMALGEIEAKIGKLPEETQCCQLRDSLIRQLKDEEQGVKDYSNFAGELGIIGKDSVSQIISDIADQEEVHYFILRGIVDYLTQTCHCSPAFIKEPFSE